MHSLSITQSGPKWTSYIYKNPLIQKVKEIWELCLATCKALYERLHTAYFESSKEVPKFTLPEHPLPDTTPLHGQLGKCFFTRL